MSLTGFNMM